MYSHNRIVVSSQEVGVSIRDIFASFANFQLHVKSVFLFKDVYFNFIQ